MPAIAFGLGTSKSQIGLPKQPQKRKAVFGEDNDEVDSSLSQNAAERKPKPLSTLNGFTNDNDDESDLEPPRKSPKLSNPDQRNGENGEKYKNLSSLRNARLQNEKASQIDSSVYDYDAIYDTLHASSEKGGGKAGYAGPKYMTTLLQTAEVRKRDQLRAREKLLQREREAEGDEFADKEKFVTGAYKKQQEEIKKMEEEEKLREAEEEQRRRRGEGMKGFYGSILKKDEERMKAVEEAAKMKELNQDSDQGIGIESVEEGLDEEKMAKELNQKGAKIVVNDEGEVVDKRQLLSAGLNVAPKKPNPSDSEKASRKADTNKPTNHYMTSSARDAKEAQRERQSRMIERQIEEMTARERQQELEEEKQQEEKTKSRITEADKSSARERFLQRKKEREEEAKKVR